MRKGVKSFCFFCFFCFFGVFVFFVFFGVLFSRLKGQLQPTDLRRLVASQHAPRRRLPECGHQVRLDGGHVQAAIMRLLAVDLQAVDGVAASGRRLRVPHDRKVKLDVVQLLEHRLRARGRLWLWLWLCNRSHLGDHGDLRGRRQEDHADDADLLAQFLKVLARREPLLRLGVKDVPLGRSVERLEQAALGALHVLKEVCLVAARHEILAVPLDRVALGTRLVLAERNKRDGKVFPDVLAHDQVRGLVAEERVLVLGRDFDPASLLGTRGLAERRRRCRRFAARWLGVEGDVAPGLAGVHELVDFVVHEVHHFCHVQETDREQ